MTIKKNEERPIKEEESTRNTSEQLEQPATGTYNLRIRTT